MVEAGELELIKIRYNYLKHISGVLWSKPWKHLLDAMDLGLAKSIELQYLGKYGSLKCRKPTPVF